MGYALFSVFVFLSNALPFAMSGELENCRNDMKRIIADSTMFYYQILSLSSNLPSYASPRIFQSRIAYSKMKRAPIQRRNRKCSPCSFRSRNDRNPTLYVLDTSTVKIGMNPS